VKVGIVIGRGLGDMGPGAMLRQTTELGENLSMPRAANSVSLADMRLRRMAWTKRVGGNRPLEFGGALELALSCTLT